MSRLAQFRQLWQHPGFRRLVMVRVTTQSADGMLQVGMASYVLFSPNTQTTPWAIAGVMAVTLLPFSIIGPFVSGLLDQWSRRQVAIWVNLIRVWLAIIVAVLVWKNLSGVGAQTIFFLLMLIAISLNRFLLAGLTAALEHTISDDEYLNASAVMPVIGPLGVVIGGATAGIIRATLTPTLPSFQADALVFVVAAAVWTWSASLASGFTRWELGPNDPKTHASLRHVWHDLSDAMRHLHQQSSAALSLTIITAQRVLFGMYTVGVTLLIRNLLHTPTEANQALLDVGIWGGATGAGFMLSVVLVPPLVARWGMRRTMVVLLLASSMVQATLGAVTLFPAIVLAGFLLGWFAQSLKIAVDTVVQAHIGETFKGRVFTIYDALFNAGIVVGAVIGALVLPLDGDSVVVYIAMGIGYLGLAAVFRQASLRLGESTFNEGTALARSA